MGHARFVDRVIGRIKWQFVDDDQRERISRNIYPFPEAF
jgi:hypothetical protein